MIITGLNRDNLNVAKFIEACSNAGHLRYAYSVFTHQSFPNTYLHNTMIRALSLVDEPNAHSIAITVYRKFWAFCAKPDTFTFPFVLKIVVRVSDVWFGRQIHGQAVVFGFDLSVHVVTGLIQMYSSCGGLGDARKVFDEMRVRDVNVWNALLAGYGKVGEMDEARGLLEMMPCWIRNAVSWTCVISGYAKSGRASEAIEVFQRMLMENVEPDEVTLLAVLSACADLGKLREAEEVIKSMPFESNATIWGSLLAASNVHHDIDVGERALYQLIKLEPNNSGNYMLLANLYSNLGRWDESRMMRKMMKGIGVKKVAGESSIEVENRVYKFISGDLSHPQVEKIHELLQEMDLQIQSNKV
ncbi:Pentatricopeptide repeat [Arabidopsis thaliana x Arabidopsis arenosa]|uniref:Pentatricopeptide repeat n=1 Tax=Arabidopsis thaliana x Arabidopsis arenosa TaxID=1240361 RepID=A0A8T1XTD3_9BRAS|nr:Pentatricopeptide repeat [Arabidopsis thaliana x Arabidopsis arenosa]